MDLINLLPGGSIIFTLIAFVVALSVIVAVHEYGHYIVGRWCGIHAEVFSLGFGPTLYSWHDKRGTKWQLAALPFGGYVKFLGDANAASAPDSQALSSVAENDRERTMHGAKLWKRAATVAAGPVFNFILSIFVFAGMFLFQGQATEVPIVKEIKALPFEVEGLQAGDTILAVNGVEIAGYGDLYNLLDELPAMPSLDYTVQRDGDVLTVAGGFGFPPVVDALQPQSAAMAAGLKRGDVIQTINGVAIFAFRELREMVAASNGAPLDLQVWREGEILDMTLAPKRTDLPKAEGGFETRWLIGVTGGLLFTPQTEAVGPLVALWGGIVQTWDVIYGSLSGLAHMITGAISTCNLSGPIGIAQTTGAMASQGAENFIWFIAVLSTAVGLLNLFPVPALDGGHLVFYAYEAVSGKPPSDRALRVLMTFGLATVLALMLFALGNDIFCP